MIFTISYNMNSLSYLSLSVAILLLVVSLCLPSVSANNASVSVTWYTQDKCYPTSVSSLPVYNYEWPSDGSCYNYVNPGGFPVVNSIKLLCFNNAPGQVSMFTASIFNGADCTFNGTDNGSEGLWSYTAIADGISCGTGSSTYASMQVVCPTIAPVSTPSSSSSCTGMYTGSSGRNAASAQHEQTAHHLTFILLISLSALMLLMLL